MEERFETFTVLISKISRSIRRIKVAEMAEFNLKSPHVSCLYYLYKQKSLTAKELCDICEEDKAAISRSIDYLERSGFIQCESAEKKRYKSPFTLTELGEKVAFRLEDKIDNVLNIAGEGVSEENRLIFYRSLQRISENLEKICEEYADEES